MAREIHENPLDFRMMNAMVVAAINWVAKFGAIGIGLAVSVIGTGLALYGAPIARSLNKLYSSLPGGFRYPTWWHRFVGGLIVGIGLLIAVVGAILAGR